MPAWLRHVLPQGRFTWNVALLAGGTALGQALVVLVSPLLTRLYTPGDFGILAVYIAILSIFSVIAALAYEIAIPLPREDTTAANVLVLALSIVLMVSLLVGVATWLGAPFLTRLVQPPGLQSYLWLLPLGLLGVGAYQVFNEWAVRKGTFHVIAQTRLSQSIGMVVTQVGLGVMSAGPIGLLVGDVIGRISGTGTLVASLWRRDRATLRQVTLSRMRQVAIRYRRFPLLSSGGLLLNSFGLQLPLLLLVAFYSPQVVGWLALAQRVLGIPLGLIAAAVSQVYVSESARALHTAPEQLPRLLMQVTWGMLAIALPYVGLLALVAPMLFPLVFGPEWAEAGVYVRLLAVMFLLDGIATPTGGTLDVLERQDLHLLREIIRVALMSSVVACAGLMGFAPVTTIALFGGAGSLIYILYFLVSLYAMRVRVRQDVTLRNRNGSEEHDQITTIS